MANITASQSVSILRFLSDLYDPANTAVNIDLVEPVPTIDALGRFQSLRAAPVLQNGLCRTYEVWYYNTSNITGAALDVDGTTPEAFGTCTVAAGQEVDTAKKEFKPNVFLAKNVTIAGSRCANESDKVREYGLAISAAITAIEKELNGKAIDLLDTNVQAATAPFFGTAGVGDDYVYENGTWDEQTLSSLEIVASDEKIYSGFRMLHGKNFRKLWHDSRYTRLNDSQRSEAAQLDSYQHTWDMRNLDSRTGKKATFLYNPNVIGFFSMAFYEGFGKLDAVPRLLPGKADMSVWSVPSPRGLTFTIVGESGAAQSVPVEYIITEQISCTGKNANGDFVHTHNLRVELRAMLDIAPVGPNGETQILGFANNTPA